MRAALDLARQMTAPDSRARPSARDVEHRSEILLSALTPTSSLRAWAERTVTQSERDPTADPWTGEILSETGTFDLRAVPSRSKSSTTHDSDVWLIVVVASTTCMVAMGTLLGSLIALCGLALYP